MTWCSRCQVVDDRILYARISPRTALCLGCYDAAGRPAPRAEHLSDQELHAVELAAKQKKLRRGGKDRYMVRSGKA